MGEGCICVVDDDDFLRSAVINLLRSAGFQVLDYAAAAPLVDSRMLSAVNCFIVDIRLPGISGFDFQSYLRRSSIRTPVIFMTGHADIPMAVKAMKAGAVDFLTKPFRNQDLLDAVFKAVTMDTERLTKERASRDTLSRYETLSAREREVMALVTGGLMNKQAAARIDVAVSTVKTHRTQIMKKMGARSLAHLVRMADQLRLTPTAISRS